MSKFVLPKIFLLTFIILLICFFVVKNAHAADPSPTPTPDSSNTDQQKQQLQQQISDLEGKISNLQSQENTLTSQIKIADNQISLSELKIESTKGQIDALEKDIDITKTKISSSEGDLNKTSHAFVGRAKAVYQVGAIDPWQVLLTSNTLDNFFTRLKYLKIVQLFDKKNIYAAEQAKVNYANQQDILVDKKKQEEALSEKLQAYTAQLNKDKDAKKQLLTETQGSEDNYQRILAQTKAQLASFQGFVSSQGGASLLSGQTSCDSWGCYYNQRDSSWGGNSLNRTSYTLADSGCLITSMAMVYTHYGHKDITPQSINSNSDNFAGIPPALLRLSINANGISASRTAASIDSTLLSGDPVIVGISYDGGRYSDHFVVLISGSNGNYQMNDPFTPNGHNISFTSHYSIGSIREIYRVNI